MSCGVCGVEVCIYCGSLYPIKARSCTTCGKEVPTKKCIYCGEPYTGYTGDPPICPHCGRELPGEFM